jgi:hypothetical protein
MAVFTGICIDWMLEAMLIGVCVFHCLGLRDTMHCSQMRRSGKKDKRLVEIATSQ